MKTQSIIIIAVLLACFVGGAAAVSYYTTHQTITNPGTIELYQTNQITKISTAADVTSLWTYNPTTGTHSFSCYIKNISGTSLTPTITYPVVTGWSFSNTALSVLAPNSSILVTITAVPPNTQTGTTTGNIIITWGA